MLVYSNSPPAVLRPGSRLDWARQALHTSSSRYPKTPISAILRAKRGAVANGLSNDLQMAMLPSRTYLMPVKYLHQRWRLVM